MPENDFKKADKYVFATAFDVFLDGELMFSENGNRLYGDSSFYHTIGKYSVKQRVKSILKDLPFINPEEVEIKSTIKILNIEEMKIV